MVKLTRARIGWRVDFACFDIEKQSRWFHEAKGNESEVYLLKKRLWPYYGPAPLTVWKGDYRNPIEVETVIPSPDPKDNQSPGKPE